MYVVIATIGDTFGISPRFIHREDVVAEASLVVSLDKDLTWVERKRVEALLESFDDYCWDGYKTVTIKQI
jgi:hypothetical protein